MGKFKWKWSVKSGLFSLAVAIIIAAVPIAWAISTLGTVPVYLTIIEESPYLGVYANEAATVTLTEINLGDVIKGDDESTFLYVKNESEYRTFITYAEILGDTSWGIVGLAPTAVSMAPGEIVMFQLGIVTDGDTSLGDKAFSIHFYENE